MTFTEDKQASELQIPTSRNPADLAQYLCAAHAAGIEVDFRRGNRKLWGLALQFLIKSSRIDVASFIAPRLALAFTEVTYFHTVAKLCARLPPPVDDASFAAFRDDATKEVQVIPRIGANGVLFGFCGNAQTLGLRLSLMHRWFGHLGVHVVYLRDYEGHNYEQGIQSLSHSMPDTLHALREIVANLGVRRILCYGNSLGGYGALRYALELQAEAVLTFGGMTNLVRGFGNFTYLEQKGVEPGLDLRPLYENARYAPRVHLVYGENHAFDRAQATNFLGLPTVTLEMAPGWSGHDVVLQTIWNGRYEHLIRWLVDPHRASKPT